MSFWRLLGDWHEASADPAPAPVEIDTHELFAEEAEIVICHLGDPGAADLKIEIHPSEDGLYLDEAYPLTVPAGAQRAARLSLTGHNFLQLQAAASDGAPIAFRYRIKVR